MLGSPHEGGSLCVTVTPPSSEEATWGPVSSEQGSSGEEGRVDGGLGSAGPSQCLAGLGDSGGRVSAGQGAVGAPAGPAALSEHHHPGREAGGRAGPGPRKEQAL